MPGAHYLTVFANRPGDLARTCWTSEPELTVTQQAPRSASDPTPALRARRVCAAPVTASGRRRCGAVCPASGPTGRLALRVRCPYTWSREEVLPGFVYDESTRIGYLQGGSQHRLCDQDPDDADPAPGRVAARLGPATWPPGVYCLTLEADAESVRLPYSASPRLYRDFQIQVASPADRLGVTVGRPVRVAPGTHFSALVALGDERVTTGAHLSVDGGATWVPVPGRAMPRPNRLRDGTLIALSYITEPIPDRPGLYRAQRYRSTAAGTTVDGPLEAIFAVPEADAALGTPPMSGSLVGRSVVELDDGVLLAGMYGWFKQDTEPDRYRQGGRMRRAYVCASADGGATWRYVSTIAYEPFLGNEGYSEVVIRRLPSRELLALIRTGGNNTAGWQDNPLVVSRSLDDGMTWSLVTRTGWRESGRTWQ